MRDIDAWVAALQDRHRSTFTSAEFLKALRALSARYVERRSELAERSPLDSAGKRAAFAAFYAPLHFFTVWEVVRALSQGRLRAPRASIVDLGCGTGAAGAAWALAHQHLPRVVGVDAHSWALAETRWNWQQLGIQGDVRRSDLVAELERLVTARRPSAAGIGCVAAWSVNELSVAKRARALTAFAELAGRGVAVLIVEPIARTAVPWWNEWARTFVSLGGRADEWKFPIALPPALVTLDEAAGFRRRDLAARSLAAGL
jgi:hypothetical protein